MNISTVLALVMTDSNTIKIVVPKKDAMIRGTSPFIYPTAITGPRIVSPRKQDMITLLIIFAHVLGMMKMRVS